MRINRSKKVILLAHCILNGNAKVQGLCKYPSSITELITILLENEIGIIQLPCPEMMTYGVKRWGHVREQFNTPYFRNECQRIMMPIIDQLKDYIKNDYKVAGVIGIEGSPSCGVNKSCSGAWGGEISGDQDILDRINKLESVSKPGIFMEEIKELLNKNNISIPFAVVDEVNVPQSIDQIKRFIME